jgi:hypothetical protein
MSTVHQDLLDFFRCCQCLLDSAPNLTPFSDEDRKRICFYTNEIAKLTSIGKPDGHRRHSPPNRASVIR